MSLGLFAELARLFVGTKLVKSAIDGLGNELSKKTDIAELPAGRGKMKMKVHKVFSLEDRMSHIIQMTKKGMIDPEIRKFTAEAINKRCGNNWCVKERDYMGEIRAVFKAVDENVRYTGDIWSIDTFQHPVRTLELGVGDCDDVSMVIASCLMSIGYPIRFRVIQTKSSNDWNHIFVLAGIPPRDAKKWVSLDATIDRPAGWHPPDHMIARKKDFAP